MLPASAILRLCIVDSGLFTPLAALFSRPATGGLWSLGFMESGRVHCSGGHSESWNLGMCSKFGLKSRSGILESWNLRSIEWKTCWLHVNRRFQDYRFCGLRWARGAWLPNMVKNRIFHDSTIHRRHENNRHSHFPRIQSPRLPSCSLERCAESCDTGGVKNAQPQSRERSTLVQSRRMVQSPHCMNTVSTL